MTTPADHDAYIAAAPDPFRPELERLRALVASCAAFSKQCGLYVLEAVAGLSDEISAAGLKATKTGITFTSRRPIPDALVERLVRASREQVGR